MSEQQRRSLVVREDERGLYVRTHEGVLRFFGDTSARVGDRVSLTVNYLPGDAGHYEPIPAARYYRGDALEGNLSWDRHGDPTEAEPPLDASTEHGGRVGG